MTVLCLCHYCAAAPGCTWRLMPALCGQTCPDGGRDCAVYSCPDYAEKQSDLLFDYQNNVKLYPAFQAYLRKNQPKLLAIWGKNDPSFIWAGAEAFRKDLPNAGIVPVNSGHFALESCCAEIADHIRTFFE